MNKLIEISTQKSELIIINTSYVIKMIARQKYGATIFYNNNGTTEEIHTERSYKELKDLILPQPSLKQKDSEN